MDHSSTRDRMNCIALTIPVDLSFVPVVTAFAEKGAAALGLEDKAATAITLAIEEIFSHLCRITGLKQTVEIRCEDRGYYVVIALVFAAKDLNIRAFNITAAVSFDDESSLNEMGLLIASRLVDRLNIRHVAGGPYELHLIKEKTYPEPVDVPLPKTVPLKNYKIKKPNAEELKLFSRLVRGHYGNRFFPRALMFPGKVVDMVGCGEYRAAVATDPAGRIGGGIIWHGVGQNIVDCAGPYLFGQDPGSPLAPALIEHCLKAIAKTPATGLINRFATKELPKHYFECLGSLETCDENGAARPDPAYYRQLHEDPGTSVWAHAGLEDFLIREYDRLVLPRHIRLVDDHGETDSPFSVLSVNFYQRRDMATLYPVQSGKDAAENLSNHIRLLERESFHCIFFEMDLGIHWHPDFTPALLAERFTPRLILPYKGQSDIVIFQRGVSKV